MISRLIFPFWFTLFASNSQSLAEVDKLNAIILYSTCNRTLNTLNNLSMEFEMTRSSVFIVHANNAHVYLRFQSREKSVNRKLKPLN